MKSIRIITSLVVLGLLLCLVPACVTEKSFEESVLRIDASEKQIATVQNQIQAISGSLSLLTATDAELRLYISQLEREADDLRKAIDANAQEMEALGTQLSGAIEASRLEQLDSLKALEEDLTARLSAIDLALEDLKARDTELTDKIVRLESYLNQELKTAKDWAAATFATLEQHNDLVAIVAGIRADVESVGKALSEAEERINGKMKESIAQSEKSLKIWVNVQFLAYYTIAQIDAQLNLIRKSISDGNEMLSGEIDSLSVQLAEQKAEITGTYQKAISKAIAENKGIIEGEIQSAVDGINQRITSEVSAINQKIETINKRLAGIEESLEEILAMVQSIAVVPVYSDGAVAISEDASELFFEVLPLDAGQRLESVALAAFSLKAVSTVQTRSGFTFSTLPVAAVKYEDGLVRITTSGKDVDPGFFKGDISLQARLSLSDGKSSLSSAYFGLKPQGPADVTSLRMAEYKDRIVDRIITGAGEKMLLTFVDGGSIELKTNILPPLVYILISTAIGQYLIIRELVLHG